MRPRSVDEFNDALAREEIPVSYHEALSERTEIPWLARPFLARQTVNMLVADPGVGKTALAVQMSLLLSAGRDLLGYHVQSPMQCLYVAAEGSRPAWIARMGTAARKLEVGTEGLRAFVNPPDMRSFQIGSIGLDQMISNTMPDLVFLDTLGYFAVFDENDASEWKQRVMVPLRGLVSKHGCSFILVHHLNKDSRADGWKKGRGTAAMFGDVDAYIRLDQPEPDEPYVTLYVDKNKYAPTVAFTLAFDGVNAVFDLANIPIKEAP